MPSSSARCAQLPRAIDKVPFYIAFKKLRDYIKGDLDHLDDSEVIFSTVDMKVKSEIKLDKDEESNECLSELTLEQIQSRSEYLEALAASAEGREIPAEKFARRRLRGGSDDEDNTLNFEDEESSQSSCSSELQRASQSDLSNQGNYTISKSLPGSSSFEVIPDVKEEQSFDLYDYGSNSQSPEICQDKEEPTPNSRLSPASSTKSSPLPSHQTQSSSPAASSPVQAYTNFGSSANVPVGGPVPMSSWQNSASHSYPPGEINNEGIPRHPMPYMPHTNPHPVMHYHMHAANSPYHQGGGVPVSSPVPPVCHGPGQFKGRPPRYQWSNGASNHMMGPVVPPSGNNYGYMYSRGNCTPCMSYQGGGALKGASNMSPTSQRNNSLDKNVNGGATYPSSHVPNFFTC